MAKDDTETEKSPMERDLDLLQVKNDRITSLLKDREEGIGLHSWRENILSSVEEMHYITSRILDT